MADKKKPRQLQGLSESEAQKKRTILTITLVVLLLVIFLGFRALDVRQKAQDMKRLEAKALLVITAFADKNYGQVYDEYAEQSFRDTMTREKFLAVFAKTNEKTNRCFGYFKDNFIIMSKTHQADGGVKITLKASIEKKTEAGSEKEDCNILLYLREQPDGEYLLYEPSSKN